MTGGEVIAIILAGGSVLVSIITAVFHSMSLSRCKEVECCGCLKLSRDVVSEEILERELVRDDTKQP
jgi:hypothetical protein